MTFPSVPSGENLRRAVGISLLLHFLLLWPTAAQRPDEEPLPALMATLRQPPSAPQDPVRHAPAPAPQRVPEPAQQPATPRPAPAVPLVAPVAATATSAALPRGEPAAPAAMPEAAPRAAAPAPRDGSAEGLRQYRLALAFEARRHKRYPPRALDAGIGGTVEVRVEVAEGRAAEVTLARPSGDASLDAAALEMMRKAAPRAAVPESLQRRSFAVVLPIVFDPEE